MTQEQIAELTKIVRDAGPFEAANDDDTGGILRYVPDTSSPDPLEHTLDHELKQKIRAALDLLTPQEELIIQLRFGLDDKERHTLKQVGEIVALSRERLMALAIFPRFPEELMKNKERVHSNQPVIRWAQPSNEPRPGHAGAAVREGEILFWIDEGALKAARVSLGRYRISVPDLLAFLQRFRIAS